MDAWPVEDEGVGEWGAMQPWPLEPELRVGSRHEKQDGGASMLQLLVELGIPECMRESLTAFTPQEFGVVATDITNLDAFLDTLQFPDEPPPVLVTARLRLLWKRCQEMSNSQVSLQVQPHMPSQSQQVPESGWVEVFPKKLGSDAVQGMIKRFKARCPSETLSPESMPSPRLLALVAKQIQERSWRYIPWKLRLSEEQHEQQAMRRPSKAPRLESFLFDDAPTREIPGPSVGKCLMQELLSLQAVSIALCGCSSAHIEGNESALCEPLLRAVPCRVFAPRSHSGGGSDCRPAIVAPNCPFVQRRAMVFGRGHARGCCGSF